MKKIFLTITLFYGVQFANAQMYSTGLKFDDEAYSKVEKVSSFGGFGFVNKSSTKYSLKRFAPIPSNQGRAGSCVGQSVGYGGLTLLKAIDKNWTNKEKITKEALSALYIYNQVKVAGCNDGSSYYDALNFLKNEGDVKLNEFEKTDVDNCNLSKYGKTFSPKTKIESYTKLFDRNDTESLKVMSTRASLLNNNPVLIAFDLTDDFDGRQIKKNNYFYKPNAYGKKRGGHAMFVVGYDDAKRAFEIQNSWGTNWGNKGYFYISYKDYAANCKYAYIMKLKEEIKPNQPKVNLSGSFDFKSIEYANGAMQKKSQNVILNNNHYVLHKTGWGIGSQFQVVANNISKDDYVYVFSIDSAKEPFVHFPKNEKLNSHYFGFINAPIAPFKNAAIMIPSKNTALTKNKMGTDYLFVLFSELKLDDTELSQNIKTLATSQGDIIDNFYHIFKNKLIPSSSLQYSNNTMNVNVTTEKGHIAPIILAVK